MFPIYIQRKITDIIILKSVWFAAQRTDKVGVLNHGQQETLALGPMTLLSIGTDFDPAEDVNVLSSTLVRLYRAILPLLSIEL